MLNQDFFYFNSIRSYITSLSHIFSDIHIQRTDSIGTLIRDITVPISYGQKDKLFNIIQRNSVIDRKLDHFLPRMDFELTGFVPDPVRQLNVVNELNVDNAGDVASGFQGVSYNFNFDLSIHCRYLDDLFQILEQICSQFNPDYQNLQISLLEELNINPNIKVVLTNIETSIDTDIGEDDYRSCEATLSFEMQGYLFKRVSTGNVLITKAIIDLVNENNIVWSELTTELVNGEFVDTIEDTPGTQ